MIEKKTFTGAEEKEGKKNVHFQNRYVKANTILIKKRTNLYCAKASIKIITA